MSIRNKMLLPMLAIVLVTAIAILGIVIIIFSGYVDDTTSDDIAFFSDALVAEYDKLYSEAQSTAALVAENSDVLAAIAAGDREALAMVAESLDENLDVDTLTITDAEGTVLVRTHQPESFGDSIAAQANVARALGGKTYTTVIESDDIALSVRSGVPVVDEEGVLMGVVSAGFRLDTMGFVDRMKSLTGAEVTIFLGDERLSTTVQNADGGRAVGTKAAENVSATVLAGGTYAGTAPILGREASVKYVPLKNTEGDVVGMLFVGRYTDSKNAAVLNFFLQGGGVALLVLAAGAVIIYLLARRITAPIHTLVEVADRLAEGDVDVQFEVNTKDEMRRLADSFEHMVENTRQQAHVVGQIAQGDLTVRIQPRGSKDVMGIALEQMLEKNNSVFSHINQVAGQVAGEARQISDGAQSLAQGSTEQASVVQQLSASISTVAASAKENADAADKAASLSESIRQNAETGSQKMDSLTAAVSDIAEASRSIGNVIKVIDDIAFQTNILALNAAVEAARAGQHGKGFAVVADEVRNLAGKSAAAAKDTGALITSSIEKAELGADIAANTATSLSDIVAGINENVQMVQKIAASSSEASEAISQINIGIEQVASVVQQNSATAEESAAASEEMTGQSEMLRQLVSQFRLGEGNPAAPRQDDAYPALPAAATRPAARME